MYILLINENKNYDFINWIKNTGENYKVISDIDINYCLLINNSIIVFDDLRKINEDILKNLKNNKLYWIMKSYVSPTNSLFLNLQKYFYGIICPDKYVTLSEQFKDKHILTFPRFFKKDRKNRKILKNKNFIIFGVYGNISIETNLPMVIHSFKKYLLYKDGILYIIGKNDNIIYYKYLLNLINKLELSDKIIFIKKKDSKKLDLDIYINASVSKFKNYLDKNIPIISTNINEASDFIDVLLLNLINLPNYDRLVNYSYQNLLIPIGYTAHVRGIDGRNVTDNNLHICNGSINSETDQAFIHISIDCRINNYMCPACKKLMEKREIFSMNVDRLTSLMLKAIITYDKFTNMESRESLNKEIGRYKVIIDTNNYSNYGVLFKNEFKEGPVIFNLTFKLIGKHCYFFITDEMNWILKDDVNYKFNYGKIIILPNDREIFTFEINLKKNTKYIYGFRFKAEYSGKLFIKNLEINGETNVPRCMTNISRYSMDVPDLFRYNNLQNLDDMLFIFLVCNSSKYLKRKQILLNFLNTFKYNYILVYGSDYSENKYDEVNKTLYIPYPDYYENLPKKMYKALEFVYYNTKYNYIYKFDDDFAPKCLDNIPKNYKNYDYYGNFVVIQVPKKWHQNKCNDTNLNSIEYSYPFLSPYAGGNCGYILSRNVISIILENQDIVYRDIFEDKVIGDIMYLNSIELNVEKENGKIILKENETIEIKVNDKKYLLITHIVNNTLLIYVIIDNKNIIYQKVFKNLIFSETSLHQICLRKYSIVLKLEDPYFTNYDIILDSEIFINLDIDIVRSPINEEKRYYSNDIYKYKWNYLPEKINLNKEIHEIKYEDIDNYDCVYF